MERLPGPVQSLVTDATRSHTLTLAAGLAFFGLISLAPRSAVLLWPATTLASGWTRGLDAVNEEDSTGGLSGLRGRAQGLVVGGGLMAGLLAILGLAAAATTLAGAERPILLVVALGGGAGVVFAFCLAAYRWLPTETHHWATLWPGALLATAGVAATTAGFAVALGYADQLADQYPPVLSTAVVLGMWLYFANTALLLGEQYNAIRRRRDRPEEERRHRERAPDADA